MAKSTAKETESVEAPKETHGKKHAKFPAVTEPRQYPSWRYHESELSVIVSNAKEDSDLGEGWSDTPAAFGIETHPEKI